MVTLGKTKTALSFFLLALVEHSHCFKDKKKTPHLSYTCTHDFTKGNRRDTIDILTTFSSMERRSPSIALILSIPPPCLSSIRNEKAGCFPPDKELNSDAQAKERQRTKKRPKEKKETALKKKGKQTSKYKGKQGQSSPLLSSFPSSFPDHGWTHTQKDVI